MGDASTQRDVYRGEIRPRRFRAASLLNLLLPGLGYVYIGQPALGGLLGACTLAPPLLLVGAGWSFGIFIGKPVGLAVLLVTWLQGAMLIDLRRRVRAMPAEYVLRRYNHPLVYGAVAAAVLVPVLLGGLVIRGQLVGSVEVRDLGMFPRLVPGDRLYFDRTTFDLRSPIRGELVVARLPGDETLRVLRVVGLPEDEIRITGVHVLVDDTPLATVPFARVSLDPDLARAGDGKRLAAMTEFSPEQDIHYAVFHVDDAPPRRDEVGPIALGAGEYFLLGDYRDAPGALDSRAVGPVRGDAIVGSPRYVYWSSHPILGWSWRRLGLSARTGPGER